MEKKILLFDFDGTISDSLRTVIRILNNLSTKYGYKKIRKGDITKLRNMKSKDALKDLGISIIKLPFIVKESKIELNKQIAYLKPIRGIKESLRKIKIRGHKLGILTSNSKENVIEFLKKNNLDVFDFIYSDSTIFGKQKLIKKFVNYSGLKPRASQINAN